VRPGFGALVTNCDLTATVRVCTATMHSTPIVVARLGRLGPPLRAGALLVPAEATLLTLVAR
jgi:hypothetical protein